MRSSNILRRLAGMGAVVALMAFLGTGPLAAYTIYLKDGSTVQAKGKYRIEGTKAYIVLPNGTQSFIKAAEIDVKRTDAVNQSDYGGNAVILQEASPSSDGTPPPAAQRRLSDVIAKRGAELPNTRQPVKGSPGDIVKSINGHPDLTSIPRRDYEPAEIAAEIRRFFSGQGIPDVMVYTGTQPSHPLVQVTVGTENEVFRGLAVGATAILHIRDRFPGKVGAFDLLLVTATGERGGQFVLTPEMASDLVAKKVQLAAFFIENVQF